MTRDEAFVEYATADAAAPRRMAYLLCHDWHLAEDLTQTALTKTYLMWRRNGPPQVPHAYARTVLTRTFIDHRRRRGSCEYVTDAVAESTRSIPGDDPSLRMTLIDALRALPPRDRAIVVLRYWEDLPVELDPAHPGRALSRSVPSADGPVMVTVRCSAQAATTIR